MSSGTGIAGGSSIAPVSLGAKKLDTCLPGLDTKMRPVYQLPYYGAEESALDSLSDSAVTRILRLYGGLVRKYDPMETLRLRLLASTRADYREKQLTIEGVVVSNKMDKSVVIASRRKAYASKIKLQYWRTRRFMAHDELNLCREGDRVIIRSCRPLSKRKTFVVVRNFGDPTRLGDDNRAQVVADAAGAEEPNDDDSATSALEQGKREEDEKKET